MKQKIELLIKWLIYAIFFVPLLVLPGSYIFPFIVPKIIFFRSMVEIMVALYVLLLIINWQQYKPKFTYLNGVVFLFLLSFIISTFTGVDSYHSFWDNHERMLGLFTLLHYFAFYFICVGVLKDWKDWKWAGRVFLLGGFLVMFIAWLQTQNTALLLNMGASRVSSTLGNPIYVGGYGLFLTFLSVLLFAREKNTLWKIFYGIVGFFGFMGMFWSGTRGSMLGLVAGATFALAGYIIVLKNYPKMRYSLVGLLILGVVGISLLYTFKKTEFVFNLPAIGRAVNTSLDDIKASPRWIAWEISIKSWKEKPIFGWGPNNYFFAFNKYYNPRSLDFGYAETWFDNAHNIIMNTLAVQGTFGLLVYLSVFVVAIVSLIVDYKKKKLDYHFMIIGGAFLVAHLVGNVTVFENPTSYLYFMFWLALITSMSNSEQNNINEKPVVVPSFDKKIGNGSIITLAVICFIFIFIFNIQPARANKKTLAALRALSQDPTSGALVAKEVLNFSSPHIDDIRSDIGRSISQYLASNWQKIEKNKANDLLTLMTDNLEKNLVLHPLDIRNHLTLAQVYLLGASINNNGMYTLKAEQVLKNAMVNSPKRQQIVYLLTGVEFQLGKMDEAEKLLEQVIMDNPRIGESYWRLAYSYKLTGKETQVQEVIKMAEDRGVKFTEQEQGIIKQLQIKANTIEVLKK